MRSGVKRKGELIALGQAVAAQRARMAISQETLGELSGLHRIYVGSVERGERNVSLLNRVSISGALGITVSELLKGIDS
jgi:transcriptional regulator with XRE-family HTH domain